MTWWRLMTLTMVLAACGGQAPEVRPAPSPAAPTSPPAAKSDDAAIVAALDAHLSSEEKAAALYRYRKMGSRFAIECDIGSDDSLLRVRQSEGTWEENQIFVVENDELVAASFVGETGDEPGAGFEDGSEEQREYWASQVGVWGRFYQLQPGRYFEVWGDSRWDRDSNAAVKRELGHGPGGERLFQALRDRAMRLRQACRDFAVDDSKKEVSAGQYLVQTGPEFELMLNVTNRQRELY